MTVKKHHSGYLPHDPSCLPISGRAADLVSYLQLEPHPEGGYFRRMFQSPHRVHPSDDRGTRSALTAIYFLLPAGFCSRWHRVASDEVWHHFEGSPLQLLTFSPDGADVFITTLGPLSDTSAPMHGVPAGWWQAARPLGSYCFMGCTVGPGFEYADFTLLSECPEARQLAPDGIPGFTDLL